MKFTRWHIGDTRAFGGYYIYDSQGRLVAECRTVKGVDILANARLIAQAPAMHGQLKTGAKALTKVQGIVVEVAKTCSSEIAEQMVAAQSYLSGVIAGNEIALTKAEGK